MNKFFEFFFKDRKTDKSRGLTITLIMMLFGLVAIVIAAYAMDTSCCNSCTDKSKPGLISSANRFFFANMGLAIIVGCASVLCGAFMGFLFGIPRSLQKTQVSSQENGAASSSDNNGFADNTNLEQISDWLTKIIVGVSLTQLPQIQAHFSNIVGVISQGFCGNYNFNRAFTSVVIIFYSISGFIFSYLWTRINFKDALNKKDLDQLKNEVHENKSDLDAIKKAQFEKEKMRIRNNEKPFAELLAIAKPELVTEYNDPQKGRWGGKSEANDRKISVKVIPHEADPEFDVILTVESTNVNKPLTGDVYFFLHDSYPESVEMVTADHNKAILQLESYEAFTVGVVCDKGNTKLELDINQVQGIPAEYKY